MPATCWPNPAQAHLLRAALLDGTAAREAWLTWRQRVDFDLLDPGSQRLLPLVHENLRRNGIVDPLLGRLKGFRRRAWVHTQILLADVTPLLAALRAAGVEVMVLKGAALGLHPYGDLGLRPMNDVDILVPSNKTATALAVFQAHGMVPLRGSYATFSPEHMATSKGQGFVSPAGHECDLHWRLIIEARDPSLAEEWWSAARPATINDQPVVMLSPTDQLLHVCSHGLRWDRFSLLRWIADAMMILKAPDARIDWERFCRHAEQCHVSLRVGHAMEYLRVELHAQVPEQVTRQLHGRPISFVEQAEYRALTRQRTPADTLTLLYANYWRMHQNSRCLFDPIGFIRYIQHARGLQSSWQVPIMFVRSRLRGRKRSVLV